MDVQKQEFEDPQKFSEFLASRGGVVEAARVSLAGAPMPGQDSPGVLSQYCAQNEVTMPAAKTDQDFKALVKAPELKMG